MIYTAALSCLQLQSEKESGGPSSLALLSTAALLGSVPPVSAGACKLIEAQRWAAKAPMGPHFCRVSAPPKTKIQAF